MKRGRQFFEEKIGVIPSVAAPRDTNPIDATALRLAAAQSLSNHGVVG